MIFKFLLYLQSCPLSIPNIVYLCFLFFSSLINPDKGLSFTFFFSIIFKFYLFYFWLHWVFVAVRGLLTAVASLAAEHRLQVHGLSSCDLRALERWLIRCGAWTQLLRSMWDLPGPGLEPMSPALADGFLTTVPPGKPLVFTFMIHFFGFQKHDLVGTR